MLRFFCAMPLALGLALALFYLLALSTHMAGQINSAAEAPVDLNFQMVRQESELQLRKRQLPPEPELSEQQPPKMPQMPMPAAPQANSAALDIDVPDISMAMDVSLAPSLHGLAAPAPMLGLNKNPTVVSRVPPRYPQRALRRKQQGQVVVEFTVMANGTVKPGSVVVIESQPQGVFDKAVLRAIQRWTFERRMIDGQPQAYQARQVLEFKLEK